MNDQPLPRPTAAVRRTTLVAISEVQEGESPRSAGLSQEHVQTLAELVPDLPPILVHAASMRVLDGMHRLRAHRMKGCDRIEVEFFEGAEDQAFIAAVETNVYHGLPLSLDDRKVAATRILSTDPRMSDRAVARIVGLSPKTIGRLRERASADLRQLSSIRVGRDGRVRPMDSSERRRVAAELLEQRPTASLRAIAREAGISATTVRDVRERLRQGKPPETPSQQDRGATAVGPRGVVARNATGGAGADLHVMLAKVGQDPALRYTDAGRSLVRWLEHRLPVGWHQLVPAVPPHSAALIGRMARRCADEWRAFAQEVEQDGKSRRG